MFAALLEGCSLSRYESWSVLQSKWISFSCTSIINSELKVSHTIEANKGKCYQVFLGYPTIASNTKIFDQLRAFYQAIALLIFHFYCYCWQFCWPVLKLYLFFWLQKILFISRLYRKQKQFKFFPKGSKSKISWTYFILTFYLVVK